MPLPVLLASDEEVMLAWVVIGAICIVPSIGYFLYRWRKAELDTQLKRDMIDRGMSAEEIERVLAAGNMPAEMEKL